MTTAREVVYQEADALNVEINDSLAEFVLWEKTGFPGAWNIPDDGDTPEECLRTQVRIAIRNMPKKIGPSVWKHLVNQD